MCVVGYYLLLIYIINFDIHKNLENIFSLNIYYTTAENISIYLIMFIIKSQCLFKQ